MENSNCIVSVAFREPYITHQAKQFIVIAKQDYVSNFNYFTDELPTKNGTIKENIVSEFQKSLYGFKVHAIADTIKEGKFKKVIWLDPSVLPTISIQVLFDSLDEHPIIVRKGEHPLSKMTNQKAKDWFGVTDEQLEGINHIGGTVYGFNFNNQKAVEVFNLWKEAEENGIFGTQDEFMAGHWADESCMALAMFKIGVLQYWEEKFTYLNQKEL